MPTQLSHPTSPLSPRFDRRFGRMALHASSIWTLVALLCASLGLALSASTADAQSFRSYRVVVHPDNPATALPTSEVSDLFLGKTQRWSHGPGVRVVDQDLRSPVRSAFTHDMHDRSVESVHQLWQRRIMSGRAQAPTVVTSDADVLQAVSSDPGAVGYVSSDAPLRGVRELPVVELPERVVFQAPSYTEAARRAGVQGVVVLRLTVDEAGEVADVQVVKDLPMGLVSQAVRSARTWRYEPAVLDDRPVRLSFDVAVRFDLDGSSTTR